MKKIGQAQKENVSIDKISEPTDSLLSICDNNERQISKQNSKNTSYNCFYAYMYAFIHSLGGFYFGFTLICINNLGESIFKKSMHITDDDKYEQV